MEANQHDICAVIVLCWIAALIWSDMDIYCMVFGCYPLDVVGAIGGTFCLYLLCRAISKYMKYTGRFLAYIGTISLIILCVHHVDLMTHMANHIRAALGMPELSMWWMYVYRYILTVIVAAGIASMPVFINRLKARKVSN